jgi:hypothetical protein
VTPRRLLSLSRRRIADRRKPPRSSGSPVWASTLPVDCQK